VYDWERNSYTGILIPSVLFDYANQAPGWSSAHHHTFSPGLGTMSLFWLRHCGRMNYWLVLNAHVYDNHATWW